MKISALLGALTLLVAIAPALADDDAVIARMATCQDSWFELQKSDPAKMQKFVDHIRAGFTPHDNDPYWLPKAKTSILGFNASQVFPESIGMAVGFSVTVDVPFDQARAAVEKAIGKKFVHCETGDDMRMCDLELAEQHDVGVMAEDTPKATQTLVGCYYFYEK
ncbi:MAG TPA: hypothetical protein VIJ85_00030 [Rhizomicrobium sp.]